MAFAFFTLYAIIAGSAILPAAVQYVKNDADYCDQLFFANYDSAIMEYNKLNEHHHQIANMFNNDSRRIAKATPGYKINDAVFA